MKDWDLTENALRPIPQKRIIDKMNEYMSRLDYAGAERHLKYWLAEARATGDRRGELTVLNELIGHARKTDQRELARRSAEEALALGRELAALTGLEAALFLPLAKVVAVSLVSRVGSALCADAGQSALARILESAGAFCALSCAVPLLRAAAELLEAWL
jgi:hypothetical protein